MTPIELASRLQFLVPELAGSFRYNNSPDNPIIDIHITNKDLHNKLLNVVASSGTMTIEPVDEEITLENGDKLRKDEALVIASLSTKKPIYILETEELAEDCTEPLEIQ